MLSANSIKYLHDRCTKHWHEEPDTSPYVVSDWEKLRLEILFVGVKFALSVY